VDEQIEIMKAERAKHNSGQIRFTTAKFFLDGSIEGLDGCLLLPYGSASGKGDDYKGVFLWEEEKLVDAFQKCLEAGFQIHCHSIGDGAANKALNALEKAKRQLPEGDYRTVFTHLQLVSPADIKRMKAHNIVANVQTYWHLKSPVLYHQIEKPLLGERAEREYPLQSLFQEGIVVSASSDYPVTPDPNPFYAIEAGVTRNLYNAAAFGVKDITNVDESSYLLNKEERASVSDMVRAFTINGAYSGFQEKFTGSLESGKAADFIEVSADPFEINPSEIEFITVKKTYFSGRLVYSAESAV
jgi:predicted amidohydrolase YtcJ